MNIAIEHTPLVPKCSINLEIYFFLLYFTFLLFNFFLFTSFYFTCMEPNNDCIGYVYNFSFRVTALPQKLFVKCAPNAQNAVAGTDPIAGIRHSNSFENTHKEAFDACSYISLTCTMHYIQILQ